jgi:hypothetical protein
VILERLLKTTADDTEPAAVHEIENDIIKHFYGIALNMDIYKPYSCTKESYFMKFKSKSDWRRHEETHFLQSGYVCLVTPACKSKIFPRKDKFLEHLKRVHDHQQFVAQMKNRSGLQILLFLVAHPAL